MQRTRMLPLPENKMLRLLEKKLTSGLQKRIQDIFAK
jgi:hypothetical protein